ncbi:MAG: TspO/MBR-related protein [Piptocephalis tieghemiana]|nr:MAG: TspO/MBR-related protein [Piptocephalis tieghemiana]
MGLFATLPLAGGMITALPSHPDRDLWYDSLKKPPLTAPKKVFAPAWTILYVAMGYAAYRVERSPLAVSRRALTWFGAQLALNYAWTPLFFHCRQKGAAVLECAALGFAVCKTTSYFASIDELAGRLMLPYLAWVAYAGYVSAGVWWLNGGGDEARSLEERAKREAQEMNRRLHH